MKKIAIILAAFIITPALASPAIDINAPKTIVAPKIEYNVKNESIKTSGTTEISSSGGGRITLVDSYMSSSGQNISGDDIQIWLGEHVYIESEDVTRNGDLTIAHDATFTACYGCNEFGNAWEISATTIEHNLDSRMMRFYNPVFWIARVPVLWFPFYTMPDPGVKHKSGILFPSIESTNYMGTQINLPIYISLSDSHDLTITPSYLTKENPLFQLEHRLNIDHGEFRTRGMYTNNKEGKNRWAIFNNDVIELGEYARLSAFLERTSDKTFLQKYGFYDDQPYLDSGARLELFGQTGYVVADAHMFQELRKWSKNYATPSGNILPNIRGVYQTEPIFYETYATFNADVLGISGDDMSSQRAIGMARLVSPWTIGNGNRLTASVAARYDVYHFKNTKLVDHPDFTGMKNRFLPSGYIELGRPVFKPGKWTQIIEPRARLTVMRHIDDDHFATNNDSAGALLSDATLFSNNRFSGLDLWENGTYADYGIKWGAFDTDGRAVEVFLGQTYDLEERADTNPNSGFHNGASDYVGRVKYNSIKWLEIGSRFRLDRDTLALRHMETTGKFGTSRNYAILGHIWSQQFTNEGLLDDNINELTAGIGIGLTRRMSVRFSSVYNVTEEEFLRHSGMVMYNHPCYYLSLGYQHSNTAKGDYVGNTTFQFRFGITINGQKY